MISFFGKNDSKEDEEEFTNGVYALAIDSLFNRQLQIAYNATFHSDAALLNLFARAATIKEKYNSINRSTLIKNIKKYEEFIDATLEADGDDQLKQSIREYAIKAPLGNAYHQRPFDVSDLYQEYCKIDIDFDLFETYTSAGFAIKKFLPGSYRYLLFENTSYAPTQIQKLKDFRLRLLAQCAMNLAALIGETTNSVAKLDNWAFKVQPLSSFIENSWGVELKQFNDYAIFHKFIDDEGIEHRRINRSNYNYSSESSLLLGSY